MKASIWLLLCSVLPCLAALNVPVRYQLLGESTITDECQICGRPTVPDPMRGSFDLILREENPLSSRYDITNVNFYSVSNYVLTGSGTYEIGGHLAIRQTIVLNLEMWRAAYPSNVSFTFTNSDSSPLKNFPVIGVQAAQTTPNLVQFYTLNIAAAPFRALWFSTTRDVSNGGLRAGDLAVYQGGTVISNLSIDAFHAQKNGAWLYSPSRGSSNVQEGDILRPDGTVFKLNQELTVRFGIQPSVPDVGLDAFFIKEDGEALFSIRTNEFGELKGPILKGDLLSSKGEIVANNLQLLERFNVVTRQSDYGLDALFQWPHGEIWFSTEDDFMDANLGEVRAGDLLSDQGYIVFRNWDLISGSPSDADAGLDALHVVIDTGQDLRSPELALPAISGNDLVLRWVGEGTAFQVFKAPAITGPFAPLTPIMPHTNFRDHGTLTNSSQGFYLLQQY